MERYSAYKDSGIDWIGEIPMGWSLKPMKALWYESKEIAKNGDGNNLLSVSEYYGVDFRRNRISSDDVLVRAGSLEGYKICHPNDLVMNIMLAWKGAQGISQYTGLVSPSYGVFRPRTKLVSRYMHYLLRTSLYSDTFKRNSTGIIDSRLRLYPDVFMRISCLVPPQPEQQAIADYLDEKTGAIDTAIKDIERSIELLNEYRQSVISEAVTKGLDPTVPMKNSDSELLGTIPAHWKQLKLRFIGTCQNGISKSAEYFGKGYPFITYGNVYRDEVNVPSQWGLIQSDETERNTYSLIRGDILFTRTSETIDEVGISSTVIRNIDDACFAGFLIRVRPTNNVLLPEFSKYYFRSNIHRSYFAKEMMLVTRASLSQNLLKNLVVLLPPIDEQRAIANYLDEKCNHIDSIIQQKQSLLVRLREYRSSLISECVTGKVKVPGVTEE